MHVDGGTNLFRSVPLYFFSYTKYSTGPDISVSILTLAMMLQRDTYTWVLPLPVSIYNP